MIASNGVPIPTRLNKKLWTPRFVANYQANQDMLVYASATKGFKSGGWNARGYTANTLLPFGPEETWSYEIGMKSEWFDRRLRVNLTAFYQDTSGLQTPSAFVAQDGTVSFITQNFADYHNRGVELEVLAQPVPNASLFYNMGFQKDNYVVDHNAPAFNTYNVKSVSQQQIDCLAEIAAGKLAFGSGANNAVDCAAGIVTATGDIARPVRSPRWSMAGGGSYDFKLPSAGIVLTPSVNVIYRSPFEVGTANGSFYTGSITSGGITYPANPYGGTQITGSHNSGYVLVNASFALRTDDNNWTVSLECNNCFDKTYVESSLANTTYISQPRTWLLRAKRKF
jgi:iron complex outermembrane receptor protein